MAQPTQLTPTEQDALVKQIGLAMLRVAPDDWEQLTVDYRAVGRYAESTGQVTYSDGAVDSWEMPADLRGLFARLRAGMYREGRGTWFNARYKLDHPSSYNLEYDREEPGWDMPPPPQAYPDDMRLFPRTDENVPDWLRRRLAAAPPPPGPPPGGPDRPLSPPTPRFRVARIFDGPGEDGRPSVNRPEVDELDISQLLDYLDGGPLVGPARGYDVDRLDPNGQQSVPVAFHTDGTWIWPAAVNYYLREHDISPEPDLVEHVRRMRFKLPQVDEQTRSAAQLFLGPPPGPPGPRPGPPGPGGPPAPAPTRAMPVPAAPAPPAPAPAPPKPAAMTPPRAALPSQGPPAQQIDQLRARLDDLDVPETAYRIGAPTGRGWIMEQTDEGWRVGWHDREWVAPAMFEDVADASAFLLGKLMLDTDRWAAGPKNPELPPAPSSSPMPSSMPPPMPSEDRGFEPMSAPIDAFEPMSAPIEGFAPAGEPVPARPRQVGPPPGTPGYATPPPGTPGYGDTPRRFSEPAGGPVYSDPAGGSGFTDDAGFADSPGFAKPSGRFSEPPGPSDYADSPGSSDYAKPSGRFTEPPGNSDYNADSPGDFAEPSGESDYAEPRSRFTEPSGNSNYADSPDRSGFSGSPGYGEPSGGPGFSEPAGESDSPGRAGRPDYAESSSRSSFSEPSDSSDPSGRSAYSEPSGASDFSDSPAFSGVPGFSEPSPKYVPRSSFSEPSDKSDYSSEPGFSESGAPGYSEPSDGFAPSRPGPPPGTPQRPQPAPTMAMEPASPPRGIELPARGEQSTVLAARPNGAAAAPAGSEWPITPLPGEPPLTLFRGKRVVELEPGTEIDRFGDADGNLVYAAGTPFAERSLVPDWIDRPYHAYRVRQPVQVLTGAAIPWFDQPGGGTAYLLPDAVGELVTLGHLVEVDGRDRPA